MADVEEEDLHLEEPTDIRKKLDFTDDVKTAEDTTPLDTDHMKVFLRVRPFSSGELHNKENQDCIKIENENLCVTYAPKDSNTFRNAQHRLGKGVSQKFTFSKIFTENAGQKQFFDEAVLRTVKEFINGQNCLMFTYGVTNSGKTYTIQGVPKDVGILPRALDVIFNSISDRQWEGSMLKPHMFCDVVRLRHSQEEEEKKIKNTLLKLAESEENEIDMTMNISRMTADSTMSEDSLMIRQSLASNASTHSNRDSAEIGELLTAARNHEETTVDIESQGDIKFSVWVTFAEIYNENIHDLLEPIAAKKKPTRTRTVLHLRDDKKGTPYVRGLREIQVSSADEAYKLLTVGKKNLQIACTKLNRNSSRSHCIFTIKMLRVVDKENPNVARMSMLSFCDLAGSERYTKTQSMGDRIKEAGNINTSLLTLGRCIQVLRHNQTNKDHQQVVPFRDSKLTRLFQSFFSGKGRASMIVNVNQCASTFDETLHALKYSAIAKQIIVVQEPEKPKRKPPPERQFSMLLNQTSRETIGWATPGTCAKVFAEEEALEEADEDSEEETCSETEREKELVELLEQMKRQLVEEKRKQILLEVRIREEVCTEMSTQLVEIETHYCERLKREQAYQEEKAEKRMEILTQSVLKSRKRQRIFDDTEQEEYVSAVILHAEKIKVQKLEKDLDEMRDQVEILTNQNDQLREAANVAVKERDKLQQENTSVKFQMSDMEIKLEKSENSKVDQSIDQSGISEIGDTGAKLAEKLSETETELERQKQSVTKLQQVIDMLQCNSADGDSKLRQAQKDLHKATKQLSSVQEELSSKESALEDLHKQLGSNETTDDELQKQLASKDEKIDKMEAVSSQQDEQLGELQSTLDQITTELEKLQKENEEQDKMMAVLRQENSERQAKYDALQATVTQKDATAPDVELALAEKGTNVEELQAKIRENETTMTGLEEEKANLEVTILEMKDSKENMAENSNSLERQLAEAQQLVQQRESELESHKLVLESKGELDNELSRLKDEVDSLMEVNKKQKEELQGALDLQKEYEAMEESKDGELQAAFAMQDKLKDQVKTLEDTLERSKSTQDSSSQDLDVAKQETSELKTMIEAKNKELEIAHALHDDLRSKMESLRSGLEEARIHLEKAGIENQEQLCEMSGRLAGMETSVDENSVLISDLTSEVSILSKKLRSMQELLNQANDALEMKKVELDEEYQPQIESGKSEISGLNEELDMVRKQHKESQNQMEDYIVKVNEQVETIGELTDKLKARVEEKSSLEEELELEKSRKLHCKAEVGKLQTELKIQQDLLDRENDKFESRVSEFEQQIKDLQEKLDQATKQEARVRELAQDMERKYSTMQVSMEIMNEETEVEREEHENVMNQTRLETQGKESRISELEAEIQHLNTLTNGQERDKTEAEAELAELKQNVCGLEQKLSDAEYNHQISCRQVRREKTNVEKLLKTAEDCKDESEKQAEALKSELEELKLKLCEVEKGQSEVVEKHKARAEKMEGVVTDLEICLTSSKDHEAKSIIEAENLKKKCRRLEQECNNKEDTICSLTEEVTQLRDDSVMAANISSAENTAQMEALRREAMEQKQVIDDLQQEMHAAHQQKKESQRDAESKIAETTARIHELEKFNESLEDKYSGLEEKKKDTNRELDDLVGELTRLKESSSSDEARRTEELRQLQLQLEGKTSEQDAMENMIMSLNVQCDELRDKLEESSSEITSRATSASETIRELEDQLEVKAEEVSSKTKALTDVVDRLSGAENSISDLEQKLIDIQSQASSEGKDLQSQLIGKTNELVELQNKLERREATIEELRGKKVNMETELELLRGEMSKNDAESSDGAKLLEAKLQSTCAELESSRDKINEHVGTCANLEQSVLNLEEQLRERNELLDTDASQKDEIVAKVDYLEDKLLMLEAECRAVKSDGAVKEERLQAQLEQEQHSVVSLKATVSDLEAQVRQQAPKVEECELLQSQVGVFEKQLSSLEVAVSDSESVKCKVEELEVELEKEQKMKRETERVVRTLQEEVDDLEKRLSHKVKLLSESSQLRDEVERLQEDMAQKQQAARKERTALEDTVERLERDVRTNKAASEDLEITQKKLADLEEGQDAKYKCELDSLKTSSEETGHRLQVTVSRVKGLEEELASCKSDLERKESRLKSRTEALTNFMTKMDQEKNGYDIALKDAKSNEMVIEHLKQTLQEQESTMQEQDKVLQNREDEIKQIGHEIQQHIDRCSEYQHRERLGKDDMKRVREERDMTQRKLRQFEDEQTSLRNQVQELQKVREMGSSQHEEIVTLQRSNDRAEERLTKAKAKQEEAEKQLRDNLRYEDDFRETTRELQHSETRLKDKDEELAALHRKYDFLKSREAASQHDLESSARDSNALKTLKTKFHAKEEQVRLLEQEKSQWKSRAETIEEQKAQELEKWRCERDKLVVQIEKILKDKESKIAVLEDGSGSDTNPDQLHNLQKQVEDKDAIIKELSAHLDKTGGRNRRHRNRTAGSSEEDSDHLRQENAGLQRQLEIERLHHHEEVKKITKAKDCIIQDMRQQNHKLSNHISGESDEPGMSYHVPTGTTSTIAIDLAEATTTPAKSKVKRGRQRKRKSSENETTEDEPTAPPRSTSKRGRKSSRSTRPNKSLHLDENDDPSLGIICEEGVIDLDEPTPRKSSALLLHSYVNNTDTDSHASYTSPIKSAPPPAPQSKRKKRLKSPVDDPLMVSPAEQTLPVEVPPSPHDIVKRKLRSRRK